MACTWLTTRLQSHDCNQAKKIYRKAPLSLQQLHYAGSSLIATSHSLIKDFLEWARRLLALGRGFVLCSGV